MGPYSKPYRLAALDGRSREGRLVRDVRRELTRHVGGRPTATKAALIDRAAWLTLHVAQLDAKAAAGRGFTDHDARTYLAWSNSLARTLRHLGLKGAKASAPARSLAEHLAERRAAS